MSPEKINFPRFRSFYYGLTLPLNAASLILSKPKLIFWSIIPIIITIAMYWLFVSEAQTHIQLALTHSLSSWQLDPAGWLGHLLFFLTKILLLLFSAFTFSFVASITACPFNDFLAEESEAYTSPRLSKVPKRSIYEKFKLIGLDLLKSLTAVGVTLVALLFSWIPLVNFLALILTFLLVTFQFISYPQSRRGEGIRAGAGFVWKYFYACLGFGAVITFLFTIPIISSFSLPLAVVGGTLLVARANGSWQIK